MKNLNRKKRAIIIIIIIVILLAIISFLYFLSKKEEEKYPETPIIQETLYGYEEDPIDMSNLPYKKYEPYKIFKISNSVNLEAVERMVKSINYDMVLTKEEGIYYHWDDSNGNLVTYSLSQNKVKFDLKEGINWNESELDKNSFTKFVREYFNKEWDYDEVIKKNLGSGMLIYYANRLTEDGVRIEMPSSFSETDSLIMRDGKIVSGDILLVDFIDFGTYAPLLDTRELAEYINMSEYPKTINIDLYHVLPVFSDFITNPNPYLDPLVRDIIEGEKNCRGLETDVVYYYTNFDHNFLTPVFKLYLECEYEYMNQEYYFVGTGYASAIDPSYISTPE